MFLFWCNNWTHYWFKIFIILILIEIIIFSISLNLFLSQIASIADIKITGTVTVYRVTFCIDVLSTKITSIAKSRLELNIILLLSKQIVEYDQQDKHYHWIQASCISGNILLYKIHKHISHYHLSIYIPHIKVLF